MKHYFVSVLLSAVLLFTFSAVNAADEALETEEQKVFYYLGVAMSGNLAPLSLTADELALVQRGMHDALLGDPVLLDAAVYGQKLNELGQQRMLASAEREALASAEYVDRMAVEEGAITTDSGLVILEITPGTGNSPTAESTVKAHYQGTLRDGTVFDSSIERGAPVDFSLNSVIPCWREALPMMKEGGKSKITCPAELAYGTRGSPGGVPGGAALTFEVELIEIVN